MYFVSDEQSQHQSGAAPQLSVIPERTREEEKVIEMKVDQSAVQPETEVVGPSITD